MHDIENDQFQTHPAMHYQMTKTGNFKKDHVDLSLYDATSFGLEFTHMSAEQKTAYL